MTVVLYVDDGAYVVAVDGILEPGGRQLAGAVVAAWLDDPQALVVLVDGAEEEVAAGEEADDQGTDEDDLAPAGHACLPAVKARVPAALRAAGLWRQAPKRTSRR